MAGTVHVVLAWCTLFLALQPSTHAAKFEITQITFGSDAAYTTHPYTSLYISYTVLEDIFPVYQNASGQFTGFVRVTIPGTMSVGDNLVSPPFLQFPNAPYWSYYKTNDFPYTPPLAPRTVVQAYINGSVPLPAGTSGVLIVQDVKVPPNCRDPGVYEFQISNATATFRPVHSGVLCAELTNLQVTFDNAWYDSLDSVLTASTMVTYYDMIVPAEDGVAVPVEFLFPEQTTPNTFVLDSSSVLAVTSFISGSSIATYWSPSGTHNITSAPSSPSGVQVQPSIARFYNPTYHTISVGTLISINITLVDLPWDCTPNQTFCITVGYFSGCGVIQSPVIGCPVFSQLDVGFTPSLYSSPRSTLSLGLQILNPQHPLFAKSKYQVTVTFPANQGYGVSNAGVQSAPTGKTWGGSAQMFGFTTLVTTVTQPPTMEFYLSGASNTGTWNAGDVYLDSYGFFNLSNISLPQNCWQLGAWTLRIGPWSIQSSSSYEVTGCADLLNVNVQFSPPYQGRTGVRAAFSFNVQDFALPLEPLHLTLPYYSGASQTFAVWSTALDPDHFQVDGMANPNLTVYKGVTYYFIVSSNFPFALLSDANTLYVNGVTVNGIPPTVGLTSGTVVWTVPTSSTPSSILYGQKSTARLGTIFIVERPRSILISNASFISYSGISKSSSGIYAEAFQTWQALDTPVTTVQFDGINMTNYTYTVFSNLVSTARPVPEGRLNFTVWNVTLPSDCSTLAPVTVRFGPWSSTATISGAIHCPQLTDLSVRLSTNVCNESGVVAYFTFNLSSAPLSPSSIRALFPPDNGFTFSSPSIQAFSWSGGVPAVTNYWPTEVSVAQTFSAGTSTAENGTFTVAVYGVTNPSDCINLGGFSLRVDQWRADYTSTDRILCPVLSALDVRFIPNANQSALTNASITFTTSDSIDPRFIRVLVPSRIDTSLAQFSSAMGWTLGGMTKAADLLTVDVVGGSRIPAGNYTIILANVRLPRGNCSDLGEWSLQIGTSLNITANPDSDVVQHCVTLEDLVVTFSPDGEQGQLVNMTVAFTIRESPLSFVAGDSDWLTIVPSVVSGVEFTISSKALDIMGSWVAVYGDPTENRTHLYQGLSSGLTLPVGTRTSFIVSNVQLPSKCPDPGMWEVSIGIWNLKQTPPSTGSLTVCPTISNLEVSYTPNIPGSENVEALVNFTVQVIRLRPQPGSLQLNFPAASAISFSDAVALTGLADWSALSTIQIVDPHTHPSSQETTYSEIAVVQPFHGSPLEPGNYSFRVKGVNLPNNHCNNLGLYKLSVGNWSSPWTDPLLDTLTCRGLVSPINVMVAPSGLGRLATGANYTFDFVVPDCRYNQIEITFPTDFTLSNSTAVVSSYGVDLSTSSFLTPATNTFTILNISHTCFNTPILPAEAHRRVTLTLDNVQVGNSCDSGVFSITTKTCSYFDRSAGRAAPVWMCVASEGDATGSVSTQAMPVGCGLCNACYFAFRDNSRSEDIYECYHNGIRFQRPSSSFSGVCSEVDSDSPVLW
eukprot:GGOE01042983.1.p1 GENE.GGOE01042983.1~~GGOE01042983.1.p1  ORF type:complete len:1532 (-),score=368.26 GGOE01042983.1:172-4698(-)